MGRKDTFEGKMKVAIDGRLTSGGSKKKGGEKDCDARLDISAASWDNVPQ